MHAIDNIAAKLIATLIFLHNNMLTWVFLLSCYLTPLINLNNQHISVLTTCTFMLRRVCTIELSFFKTTSGMHCHPLEGSTSSLICFSIYFSFVCADVRRKTIYEYHKIDMKKPNTIANATAIVFKALPTCISFTDCDSCLRHNTSFHVKKKKKNNNNKKIIKNSYI